ncbi:MAG: carboxypeptidase-like regulatory domain-containing protein [Gemmataceae bacterium]|nr:carboxypeptidase-like regulatory domain-containing protein [Gemmataceae bacterium]
MTHHRATAGRRVAAAAILTLALSATSCGKKPYHAVPTYPVSGVVYFQGKPAGGALVRLVPADSLDDPGALTAQGQADADGRFRLSTYVKDDGAPAGTYKVTISWPKEPPPKSPRPRDPPPDRLKGRYADPTKSPWEVHIREEPNALEPFRLP